MTSRLEAFGLQPNRHLWTARPGDVWVIDVLAWTSESGGGRKVSIDADRMKEVVDARTRPPPASVHKIVIELDG
jgi:hypothetical protein